MNEDENVIVNDCAQFGQSQFKGKNDLLSHLHRWYANTLIEHMMLLTFMLMLAMVRWRTNLYHFLVILG